MRVTRNNPTDTLQLFSFLPSLSQWIVGFIHSLSLSQTTHHCSGKKGAMITFSRWDCFESKLMTFCRQNYSSPFCGSAIARDLYSLPSSPPCLLQEAILPKITLLIVVRSKAILKFKLDVEIRSKRRNLKKRNTTTTTTTSTEWTAAK